jgi:diketogulonate reductase-like aldo/keto reductase
MSIKSINDVTRLNNGVLMPRFGLGVWKAKGQEVVDAVTWAIEAGYRHIDTAAVYGNEKEVGTALQNCGISRKDLFITSKVAKMGYKEALDSMDQTLSDLQTDYVDLFLIHWPHPELGDTYLEMWRAMERIYKEGKARAIGVANFYAEYLQRIMNECAIKPAVNQFECHPYYQMPELQAFCKENGIQYEAYSPLAGGAVFGDERFAPIAEKYGKDVAQIILRWELQRDIVVIPKSVKQKRVLSNMDVFDFELEEADMKLIDAMDINTKVTCARPDQLWPDFLAEKEARIAAGSRF